MSKFLRNIFLFIAFTVLFYPVMLIVWGEFAPAKLKKNLNYRIGSHGHMYTRLKELKATENPDILVVGSSTVYRGYDPRIFEKHGIKLFNLGSSAQTPIQTQYLLEKYLLQVKPKLLVYDVSPLVFSIDGIESSLDLIANDEFNTDLVYMAFNVNHLKVYNTLIFAKYVDLFNRKKEFKEDIKRRVDTYITGGFVERELSFNTNENYESLNWAFNRHQFKRFEDIIAFLKSSDIQFFLVQSPISPSFYHAHLNNDEFDDYMLRHGEYMNFNQIINLDDSLHFYDAFHLNQNGVEKYNHSLIEIMLSGSIN